MGFLKKASKMMIGGLETGFYLWGKLVATYPFTVVFCCTLACGLLLIGFLRFSQEHRADRLWIPEDSSYNVHEAWLQKNFKKNTRFNLYIYESENVLTPKAINEMLTLYKAVQNITIDGKKYEDICARLPIINIYHSTRSKREALEVNEEARPVNTSKNDSSMLRLKADSPQEAAGSAMSNKTISSDDYVTESDLDTDMYYDWSNFYNDDGDDTDSDNTLGDTKQQELRINFFRFAKDRSSQSTSAIKEEDLPDDIYCNLFENLEKVCLAGSLLDIWKYKEELIETTTQKEILDAVNLLNKNPWTDYNTNFLDFLGDKVYNSTGHVIAAKSAQMYWITELPDDFVDVQKTISGVELDKVDAITSKFEEQFIQLGLNYSSPGVEIYVNAHRSFSDVSGDTVLVDGTKMAVGWLIMFVYTIFMLGKMNSIEMRCYLAASGLLCIAVGLVVSVAVSSAAGFPYTPLHAVLPFIGLGIGIDDMFVIVQCWNNLDRSGALKDKSIRETIGMTLRHGGVAITITSLTDILAFAVGSITQMPGLTAFCVTTAIALAAIYLLVITWFTAFLYWDQLRIADRRNGIFPCFKHKEAQDKEWCQFDSSAFIAKCYHFTLSSKIIRLVITLLTFTLFGAGVYGSVHIIQKFDPASLLPSESYLTKTFKEHDRLYPKNGWLTEIFFGHMNWTHLEAIDQITDNLDKLVRDEIYLKGVNSWWTPLKEYGVKKNFTDWREFANPTDFPALLGDFLVGEGGKYRTFFKFDGETECRKPTPPILASKIEFNYFIMSGPEQHIPAKRTVEEIIANSGIQTEAFSHVRVYAAWETDEIIGRELWRNLAISLACVMIITLTLIVSIPLSFFVFLCVILTLVDIIGLLYFWGITIDMMACINIVMAVGLCIDYMVHIAHAYLVAEGDNRVDRSVNAVVNIGPAVFNGGFTTFLAITPLIFSSSPMFLTFFKVFFLTVLFGMTHGLVVLPVILSVFGPMNNSDRPSKPEEERQGNGNSQNASYHNNPAFVEDNTVFDVPRQASRVASVFRSKKSWTPNHPS